MTEREAKNMARKLAEGSEIFDFERALEVVRRRPADAVKLLRMREESEKAQEERARARKRMRRALIEEFG